MRDLRLNSKKIKKYIKKAISPLLLCGTIMFSSSIAHAQEIDYKKVPQKPLYNHNVGMQEQANGINCSKNNELSIRGDIEFDGIKLKPNQKAFVKDKVVYLPIREIYERLGAQVKWDKESQIIGISIDGVNTQLIIGHSKGLIGGEDIDLDAPVLLNNSEAMVPSSFLAKNLGIGISVVNEVVKIDTSSREITFADKNLENAVRGMIGKNSGSIYPKDIQNIKSINLFDKNIKSIKGLARFHNLETLILEFNQISDISTLKYNDNLTYLNVAHNRINKLDFLPSPEKLQVFYFGTNPLFDYSKIEAELKGKDILIDVDFEKAKYVVNRIDEIISKVITPNMTELEKEKAIYDYVIINTYYKEYGPISGLQGAYGVLSQGYNICDGYAETMMLLLNRAGIECFYVIGEVFNGASGQHAWNIVKINGDYKHIDATWDDLGDKAWKSSGKCSNYEFFNVKDKKMRENRTWNYDAYPQCK